MCLREPKYIELCVEMFLSYGRIYIQADKSKLRFWYHYTNLKNINLLGKTKL